MSQKSRKSTSSHNNSLPTHNYYLLPVILILSLVPLIARSHNYDTRLAQYPWFSENGGFTDIFLYWKSLIFTIISLVIACILLYKFIYDKKSIKFTPLFIPLGLYAGLSLLSSIFSKYSYFSFHGIYEQFESIWVLLGYCLVTYYCFLFINTEENLKKIFRWFMLGITLLCLIGISQVLSHDFYRTAIGKMSFLPIAAWENLSDVVFNFELGRVYASLYNPNYVGIYVSLITPLLIILILFNKKLLHTIGYLIVLVGLLLCLFASQSRSGIIALFVSLPFMIIVLRRYIVEKWRFFLAGFVVIAVSFFAVNSFSNNFLSNKIIGMFNTHDTQPSLQEIQTNDDNVKIIYKGESLVIKFIADTNIGSYVFELTDESGTVINSTAPTETHQITVNDSRFPSFSMYPLMVNDYLCFSVNIDGTEWYFTNQTDGTYYYYTKTNKFDKISNPETMLFDNNQNFASTRGYIWARTIPLLKKNIIIGAGADTFSLLFPNDDYVGKYNYGYAAQIVTKPHNMYLQMGVQTGLLSLIAFLIFYGMYFFSSIKLYINHKFDTYTSQIGVGILISTVGYMVAGLTNDSTITIAPVFWALIGIGIGINYNSSKTN